jgi:hypothetical protein
MVKLPKSGAAYQSLFERDPTRREPDVALPQIVASLGLKPLTANAERDIRDRLGFALGKWESPHATFDLADVISSLNAHAKALERFSAVAVLAKGGHLKGKDLERDMEVTCQLAQSLKEDPTLKNIAAAYAYLTDFGARAALIASAGRSAAKRLQAARGTGGGSPYVWYDGFTAVLLDLCKKNKIEPEARIERSSGEPVGGLAKMASAFERLLPPWMRSPTPEAMVKRLQRSLVRLAQRDYEVITEGQRNAK